MEFLSVFITYFGRRLSRVWWQVALVAIAFWLPLNLGTSYFRGAPPTKSALRTHHKFEAGRLITPTAIMLVDVIVWSYGLSLVILIVRESELIQKEFRESNPGLEEYPGGPVLVPQAPGNFNTEAWERWLPLWGRLAREAFQIWPKMALTRLLNLLTLLISLVLLCIPCLYMGVKLAFTEQSVVRDGVWGLAAFKRSWALTNGRFWKIFWLHGLGMLFVTAVAMPVAIFITLAGRYFPALWTPYFWFVRAALEMPSSLVATFFAVYLYCLYNFARWDSGSPEPRPFEEFLDYDPDAPEPRPGDLTVI